MSDQVVEILLVEDNPDDIELAELAFARSKLSNKVHVVRDGEEALAYVFCTDQYAQRDIENYPRLILLDLNLPRVDGLEVLRRIKEDPRTRSIPIVMMTSSREERDVMKSYNLGANSYIVKPIDFQQFTEAVAQIGFYWLLLNQPILPG